MGRVLVSDIMTRDPITIKPNSNLLDCAKKMVQKKVGSLLLVEKKRLVGFISHMDILWALVKKSKQDLSEIKAIDISSKKIAKISPTRTIEDAINKMKKLKFERLPVLHKGELVGMVTIRDILNFKPEFYPELEEFAEIREESNKLKRIKKRDLIIEGICEECGNYNILHTFNGMLICETCKNSS
ncbi:CBS domain-containing protein [Candidatus Pacearchaeota archaeon]|nr:CBS domain-containing protein [Candidatus Pacearchaeota archaeon]